jgi:hypothetical protein
LIYPNFVAIEASSSEESAYPCTISWSLDDGTIKTTSIIPDDDWEPWDNVSNEVDIQHLYDQGASAQDVSLELNQDCESKSVFYDPRFYEDELLEKLFQVAAKEFDFELEPIQSLFKNEAIYDALEKRTQELDCDMQLSEDRIKAMLYVYADESS